LRAGRLACTLDSLVRVTRRVGLPALTPYNGSGGRILGGCDPAFPRAPGCKLVKRSRGDPAGGDTQIRRPESPVPTLAARDPPEAVSYSAPCGEELPHRCLSTSRDVPFTLDGFHALLAPQAGCFSVFPYGTCSLSVTTFSYLALDGQHHLYSASTFKLAYSRGSPWRPDDPPGRV